MAEDISKILVLGAVSMTYNGVELGETTPNTKVTIKTTFVEAETGKYGKVPTNVFRNGTRVEVEAELMQNDITNVLTPAYPQFTLVSGSGKTKMTLGQIAGLQNTKATLTLQSFISTNTPYYDFILTQATQIGDPELMYTAEKVQIWKVKFVGCIDLGQSAGSYLGSFGDNSATADAVAPVVSSVVPAANATGVSHGTSIVWTLSKNLNGNTVNNFSVYLVVSDPTGPGTKVNCAAPVLVNNGASTTITLTPSSALSGTTIYLAILTQAIQDQVGNSLAMYTTAFTTS
jgi:hypothetical protein